MLFLYLQVIPLTEHKATNTHSILINDLSLSYTLRDLTPGASYQLQLSTVYESKESVAYASRNFTTSKFVNCISTVITFYLCLLDGVVCIGSIVSRNKSSVIIGSQVKRNLLIYKDILKTLPRYVIMEIIDCLRYETLLKSFEITIFVC